MCWPLTKHLEYSLKQLKYFSCPWGAYGLELNIKKLQKIREGFSKEVTFEQI